MVFISLPIVWVILQLVFPIEIKDKIIEDLEQVAQKDIDKDENKIMLVGKDEIKENIGRSPDYGDAIMMRMYFELKSNYKPHIA